MPYLPIITDYKPFYIQMDGSTAAADTAQRWGFLLKSSPYPVFPNPKERYSVDWKDEDGADEYGSVQYLDSVDFSVDFLLLTKDRNNLTSQRQVRQMIGRFVDEVRTDYFSVYDSYTGVGLQKVRYVGFTQSDYWYDGHRTGYVFSVQMTCDDPTTRMMLSSGAIVEYSTTATLPSVTYPIVSGYKPFYVQAVGGATATDTRTEWGLTAKADPIPVMPSAKEPFREKDLQANGNEGFASVMLQAVEFSVQFFIKAYASEDMTAEEIVLSRILDFRTEGQSNSKKAGNGQQQTGKADF